MEIRLPLESCSMPGGAGSHLKTLPLILCELQTVHSWHCQDRKFGNQGIRSFGDNTDSK